MSTEAAPAALDPCASVAAAGPGAHVLRVRWRRHTLVSTRVHLRSLVVTTVALAAGLVVAAWALTVGDYPISLRDVLLALTGDLGGRPEYVVRELRLPRAAVGLAAGAALGVSGAIFQRLARNPLASPDIIGINAGAATAAVLVLVVLGGTDTQIGVGSLLGSLLTAGVIYALSYRKGITGYRLVLVGIGVTAILSSVTSFVLTRANLYTAQQASVWLTGSLAGRTWSHVRLVGIAVAVLVPIAVALARQLRVLELGDDTARLLGARVERTRLALLASGVALAALTTAVAGPVAFVALVAPQVARRLVRERTLALLPAAACGAALMAAADLVARRLLAPTELPVGVVTAALGAPYLIVLLWRANRIGHTG